MISAAIGSCAGVSQVEHVPDLGLLSRDLVGPGRLDPGDEIVDLEHLDVRAGLRVHLREVGVHVEHPRVRVPEEADARGSEAVHSARRVEPLAQRVPRGIAVEQRPRQRPVADPRPGQRPRDLRHAAGGAVGEPLAGRHPLVVERARRLEVEDDDRGVDRLHDGEDLGRRRVGRGVEEEELGPRRAERVACRPGRLRRVHEPGRDDLRPHLLEAPLDPALVALEPLAQAVELRPVRGEPDAEHRDPRGSGAAHDPSSGVATPACRRASALRSRARARAYISPRFGTMTLARRSPPTTMF